MAVPVIGPKPDPRAAIASAASNLGLPISLEILMRLAQLESSMNPGAVNPRSGAAGLFQMMPSVSRNLGINPLDPFENSSGALGLISGYLGQFGNDHRLAIAAHNWGPGNLGGLLTKMNTKEFTPDVFNRLPVDTQKLLRNTFGDQLFQVDPTQPAQTAPTQPVNPLANLPTAAAAAATPPSQATAAQTQPTQPTHPQAATSAGGGRKPSILQSLIGGAPALAPRPLPEQQGRGWTAGLPQLGAAIGNMFTGASLAQQQTTEKEMAKAEAERVGRATDAQVKASEAATQASMTSTE